MEQKCFFLLTWLQSEEISSSACKGKQQTLATGRKTVSELEIFKYAHFIFIPHDPHFHFHSTQCCGELLQILRKVALFN